MVTQLAEGALLVAPLLLRACGAQVSDDIVGLPTWAQTELYDVTVTCSLSRATADDRLSMCAP